MNRMRIVIAALLLASSARLVEAQPAKLALDSRWADLASPDEGRATRALLALAATPDETTTFLQDRLKPVKSDGKRVGQLFKQLESSNFALRSQATTELEYLGKYIKAELQTALKATANVEARSRIQQLIDKMPAEQKGEAVPVPMPMVRPGSSISVQNVNGKITILIDGQPLDFAKMGPPPSPPGPPLSWVRAVRAVAILEHVATPQAQQLLQAIAAGESDALPTIAAREALDRLKK